MAEEMGHTRSCPALTPGEDCTCGLRWRIELQTEREMHAAWRKRACEAARATQKPKDAGVIDPFQPSVPLLVKLGSIIVHFDEFTTPGKGHEYDHHTAQQLLKDPEVAEWMDAMRNMAMLPIKR